MITEYRSVCCDARADLDKEGKYVCSKCKQTLKSFVIRKIRNKSLK